MSVSKKRLPKDIVERLGMNNRKNRYNAVNLLIKHMYRSSITKESESPDKIINALLVLLHDQSDGIRIMAIICVGVMGRPGRVKLHHLEHIINILTPFFDSPNKSTRLTIAQAISSIIRYAKPDQSDVSLKIVQKIVLKMLERLRGSKLVDIEGDGILDVLKNVLKHGKVIAEHHESMIEVLIAQLKSWRKPIRIKSVEIIGELAKIVSQKIFAKLMISLISVVKTSESKVEVRSGVMAIGAVLANGGEKIDKYLSMTVPPLLEIIKTSGDIESTTTCIGIIIKLLEKNPENMANHKKMLKNSLFLAIRYKNEGDDMDPTWKVRKLAAKAIRRMIVRDVGLSTKDVEDMCEVLIRRIDKELVYIVLTELISTFSTLLDHFYLDIPDQQLPNICTVIHNILIIEPRDHADKFEIDKILELKKALVKLVGRLATKLATVKDTMAYGELIMLIEGDKTLKLISDQLNGKAQIKDIRWISEEL